MELTKKKAIKIAWLYGLIIGLANLIGSVIPSSSSPDLMYPDMSGWENFLKDQSVVVAIISSFCVRQYVGYGIGFQLRCLLNGIIIGILSSIVAYIAVQYIPSLLLSLVVGIAVMSSSYVVLNKLFHTKEAKLVKDILTGLKTSRIV